MSNEKEKLITKVAEKFVNTLDEDKKMFVLGFMEGIQAERAAHMKPPPQLDQKTA